MPICPQGHESPTDDYCDACGRPMRTTGIEVSSHSPVGAIPSPPSVPVVHRARPRNAASWPSRSWQILKTSLLEMPVSAPGGLDRVVDGAGGDAVDAGLHDDRVEGLVDAAAALQQGGEEASRA